MSNIKNKRVKRVYSKKQVFFYSFPVLYFSREATPGTSVLYIHPELVSVNRNIYISPSLETAYRICLLCSLLFSLSTHIWRLFHIVPLRATMFFLRLSAVPLSRCVILYWANKGPYLSHLSLTNSLHSTKLSKHSMFVTNFILYNLFLFFIISPFRGTDIFFNIPDICIMYMFLATQVCLVPWSNLCYLTSKARLNLAPLI